ncbi:MAG: DNA (cytosine-5-)-methyltransferase [Rhodocyclaceae bacterium]|nr:MAG: DNA (cytosine-5-)-methyltransferase [Rhodocyclaceae bacterium]
MGKKKLRAIDLYSGVGGWSLGLRMAGINVVASYERWGMANETNFKNNRHQAQTVDIRRLSLDELPTDIQIVVGSPPCTQFSYSNRGGNGDIADGLKDIIKFLTIVDYLKPKVWAMENVPRVAEILEQELLPGGCLRKFKHLNLKSHIVNMEEFGLPQKRQRCIAGNFDFELLESYKSATHKCTLGKVIKALAKKKIVDPIYGIEMDRADLRDHVTERALNSEEERINMASKTLHPVYNAMSFPDRLDRSVRTITATCTRVSRESIVIEDPTIPNSYRRLTVRERACLQGFPITFQFYGSSYGHKLRMVGNAVPPLFSYFVGQALQQRAAEKISALSTHAESLRAPVPPAEDASPDKPGAHFPKTRTFRFAIPSLRLKSGVRFDLANVVRKDRVDWAVEFYFGTPKSIQSIDLAALSLSAVLSRIPMAISAQVHSELEKVSQFVCNADIGNMQRVWSHNGVGLTRPFMLLDELDERGSEMVKLLMPYERLTQELVGNVLLDTYGAEAIKLPGLLKLANNAALILAGLIIGATTNAALIKHPQKAAILLARAAA